jgi:hypothetical protein
MAADCLWPGVENEVMNSSPEFNARIDVEGAELLVELALDMRWSWNHATDDIWKQLDSTLWERTGNRGLYYGRCPGIVFQDFYPYPAFSKLIHDQWMAKRHLADEPHLVSPEQSEAITDFGGLLLHGIYAERSSAHLLGWQSARQRNYTWSELMKRVFQVDVLRCERCGGRMKIIAAIHPPDTTAKILERLGLPSRAPPLAPAVSDFNCQIDSF